jgi:hypothetical protein
MEKEQRLDNQIGKPRVKEELNMTPTQAIYGDVIKSINVQTMTPQEFKEVSNFLTGFPRGNAK